MKTYKSLQEEIQGITEGKFPNEDLLDESITILNAGDLGNLLKRAKVINRDTLVTYDISELTDKLQKYGYKIKHQDREFVVWTKNKSNISISSDDAQTKFTVVVY